MTTAKTTLTLLISKHENISSHNSYTFETKDCRPNEWIASSHENWLNYLRNHRTHHQWVCCRLDWAKKGRLIFTGHHIQTDTAKCLYPTPGTEVSDLMQGNKAVGYVAECPVLTLGCRDGSAGMSMHWGNPGSGPSTSVRWLITNCNSCSGDPVPSSGSFR